MTYQKAVTSTQYYDEIARALVGLGSNLAELTPADMAYAIREVAEMQHSDGEEQGRQAQHYEYWEKALYGGQKQSFNYAFSGVWLTDEIFNPPEDMILKANGFSGAFRYAENLENINITLDLSEAASMGNALYGCYGLKKIKKIISSENTPWVAANFQSASVLQDIEFEGTISVSISFASCNKLSEASVLSIFKALKDYSGTDTKPTISLSSTVKNKSWFDDSIATAKGWDVA